MRAFRRHAWLAVAVAGVLAGSPVHAQSDGVSLAAPARHTTVAFSPDRLDRCTYFFVTEFDASLTPGVETRDAVDRLLFTDALGLMRNIDRTRAVGISIDAHLSAGGFRFAPTLRFKQWLAGRASLDLALGYATDDIEHEGVVGPIVDVRYSPSEWFHLQAGACRIRNVGFITYYPEYSVDEQSPLRFYAGVGLGAVPGVVSWGAQAVGFATLVAMLSAMD